MTHIIVFLLAAMCSPALAAELSNDDLAKRCDQKIIILNKQGQKVGEDLDSYCFGYLQALLNTPTTKCTSSLVGGDQTPERLLAIYRIYWKDTAASGSAGATPTLVAAYQRAFDCEARE